MIGTTIAHFRILSLLGRGGMGEVYLAENLRLRRQVALKFLSPELSDDRGALERLRREARAAAELDHPSIARIYDMQEVGGRHFLVLEYLDGETLRERLATQGRLPPEEAEKIATAIAAGLSHAHERGIVHRDIKCSNVMLTRDGGVKILDFGLARHADATALTRSGSVIGTLGYMSPEQVRGAPMDARTDLWSLGVVFYECLTGRRPFEGPDPESTLHNILKTLPRPASVVNPAVSPALDQVIGRLLEKDPTRRYGSAPELLGDLAQSPSSRTAAIRRPRRARLRGWPVLVAAIVVAAVAIPFVLRWRGAATSDNQPTPRLAVVGFADLSARPDSLAAAGLTALIQVGLADVEGCEMVAPEYLRDIQRRRFGSSFGAIEAGRALVVAREAGATLMVSGELVQEGDDARVLWRITDLKRGKVLASGKESGAGRSGVADRVTLAATLRLGEITRVKDTEPPKLLAEAVTGSPEAYRHYVAGLVARDDGRGQEARREFIRAVEMDSTFAMASFELSRNYDSIVEADSAKASAERAWRHRDSLSERDRLLLEAYRLFIEYKVGQANETYARILRRWPDCRDAHVDRVENFGFFRRNRECEDAARQGLRFYPQEPQLLARLAVSLVSQGEWEEAMAVARRMPTSGPRSSASDGDQIVGGIHRLRGEIAQADSCFRHWLDVKPAEFWAHVELTQCLYASGDLDKAIESQVKMRGDPRWTGAEKKYLGFDISFFMALPESYADAGRIVDAVTANDRGGRGVDTWLHLYSGLDDRALASLHEQEARGRQPGGSPYRLGPWDGMALARAGELPLARQLLAELESEVASDPNLPGGYRMRNLELGTTIELAAGVPDSAMAYIRALEEEGWMRGGSVDIHIRELQAEAYAGTGDLNRAIAILETMLRTYGGRTLGHYKLAGYYEKAGRPADARREYQECLRLWQHADPDYPYPARVRQRLATIG